MGAPGVCSATRCASVVGVGLCFQETIPERPRRGGLDDDDDDDDADFAGRLGRALERGVGGDGVNEFADV